MLEEVIFWVLSVVIGGLPLLFAITVHEVVHGWVASKLGDKTAMFMGRLTLNPLKHIDLIGTILVPGILLLLSGDIYGWAKPVPVIYENLNNPKRDMAIVAAAGPIANFVMAIMWAFIAKLGTILVQNNFFGELAIIMGQAGIVINLNLMIFNLLPIPPMDGSRIVSGFLSDRAALKYNRLESYRFFIWPILYSTGVLKFVISSIDRLVGGISSLVTAPIGGVINGTRAVFNKKIYEIQKRQVKSTSPFLIEEPASQPSFLSSFIPRCSTQHTMNTGSEKSGLSFWHRPPTDMRPLAPSVEDDGNIGRHIASYQSKI